MTILDQATDLMADIDTLTAGCLGCGEPVPAYSLSDLFCAVPDPTPHPCWDDCDCGGTVIRTCQTEALDDMATNPDDVYDVHPFDEDVCTYMPARWWPGIETDRVAPIYLDPSAPWGRRDPWSFEDAS